MAGLVQRLVSAMAIEPDKRALALTNRALDGVAGKLGTIAVALAPAALAKAGWDALRASTAAADAAAKQARAVGVTTEAYQELTYAAGLSGIAEQELNTALKKNTKNIYEAANGNKELATTYRRLGVNVHALKKLKPDEQLEAIADATAKLDPNKRVALLSKVLEEAGPKFASMFAGGAAGIQQMRQEAQDLGLIIPHEQAVAAEAFNDNLDRLRLIGQGLKRSFLLDLLPALSPLIEDLVKWRREDAGKSGDTIKQIAMELRDFIKTAHGGLRTLRELVNALGGVSNALKLLALVVGSILAARWLLQMSKGASMLTVANLKLAASTVAAAAPYVLLALAIAAVVALVDDFVGWTQGQDSLMGELFGPASPEFLGEIQLALVGVLGIIALIALLVGAVPIAIAAAAAAVVGLALNWDAVVDALADAMLDAYNNLEAWAKEVSASWLKWWDKLGDDLSKWWDDLVAEWMATFSRMIQRIRGVVSSVTDAITDPIGAVKGLIGPGATPAGDVEARSLAVSNARPQQNNTVNVQVDAAGLTPQQAQQVTTNAVDEALLRESQRAFASGPGGV